MHPGIFILIFLWLFGGCATIPEEQCAKINWYDLGVKDGLAGFAAADRLTRHREACAGVKIIPNEKGYRQGHQEGLTEYCQTENAVRVGLAGRSYADVCNQTFKAIYQAAYGINSLKRRIDNKLYEVSRKESELREEKTSTSRRNQLRSEIRDLDRQRESLRDELFSAERELERLRRAPAAVR
jgi:hypothetical protein